MTFVGQAESRFIVIDHGYSIVTVFRTYDASIWLVVESDFVMQDAVVETFILESRDPGIVRAS